MPALRLSFAVIVLMAVGLCSGKSVGFQNIEARSGEIFAQANGSSVCEVCQIFLQAQNEAFAEDSLMEGVIALTIESVCHVIPRHPSVSQGLREFCKMITGKESDYEKAYRKHWIYGKGATAETCKEVGIC